jgi:hypothetical protein
MRWIGVLAVAGCAGDDTAAFDGCEGAARDACHLGNGCVAVFGASADCGPYHAYAGCRGYSVDCDGTDEMVLATDPDGLCWEVHGCPPDGWTDGCAGTPSFCD